MDYKLKEAGMLEELCSVGDSIPTEKRAMLTAVRNGKLRQQSGS